MGTLINTAAIVAGGLIGLLIGSKLSKRFQTILMMAMALSVIAMSLSGIVSANAGTVPVTTNDAASSIAVILFALSIFHPRCFTGLRLIS